MFAYGSSDPGASPAPTRPRLDLFVLPGDGIGPEVVREGVLLLRELAPALPVDLRVREGAIGGFAVDETGDPLPADTLAAALSADAVFLGAVGGPRWEDVPSERRPEQGLLRLRKEMRVFANLRPLRLPPELSFLSPLRPEVLGEGGLDVLIVRELVGGIYFGEPRGIFVEEGARVAVDTLRYREEEIARVVDIAFRIARTQGKPLASVDKANVLASSRLWREIVEAKRADYPAVPVRHVLVDAFAMDLVRRPTAYGVVVTENLFGDILSDLGGALVGSLGLLPSASLSEGGPHLYEPVHGSAPDIAGKGIANPAGMLLTVAMFLRHTLSAEDAAAAVEAAVFATIARGRVTPDLAEACRRAHALGQCPAPEVLSTAEFGAAVREEVVRRVMRERG
ncbi:MAG: 3-isopropylmalate dehydrogenase [Brockia lithotrophica]|nr:3-isopropylmalate dehydrogenase [Brockia lithotrophica]